MEKKIVHDATSEQSFEERRSIEKVRDNSNDVEVNGKKVGKITSYKYKILVKDKEPIQGFFTREEMELIYRLYSSEGSALTQRQVAQYFPTIIFQDFKKILSAFSITKHGSSPLAPHTIEEKSLEDLTQITFENKERDYRRKLEQDNLKLTEAKLKEINKKYHGLRKQMSDFKSFMSDITFKVTPVKFNKTKHTGGTMVVHMSDIHLGADVSDYALYGNPYGMKEATRRAKMITEKIIGKAISMKVSSIVITNLGDSVDGYNGYTTRGGHSLPQNMNNKDQFKNFIQLMLGFFSNILDSGQFNDIQYISVDGGNHDGDVGYMINKSLEGVLAVLNPEIKVTVFEKTLGHFTIGEHTYILSHGKDAKDMFKNMPLTLNDKWENQINEYIDHHRINGIISFIKGDLHQTATTYGKKFRYKSVSSFFGSSAWIQANFGNTKAALDYEIIFGEDIFESRIVLN